MNVDGFIADYIRRWEGGMSRHPNDAGNWSSGTKGVGALLGSNFGVTGRTLAAYRKVPVASLKMADIERMSFAEACAIAKKLFFTDVGLHNLVWNQLTASILDFGWGAGPATSVKMLQDLLDRPVIDGRVDPNGGTAKAFAAECGAKGVEFMAGAWWAMREEYYEDLVVRRPSDAMYLNGWDNRSDYFTPGHPEGWWARFAA